GGVGFGRRNYRNEISNYNSGNACNYSSGIPFFYGSCHVDCRGNNKAEKEGPNQDRIMVKQVFKSFGQRKNTDGNTKQDTNQKVPVNGLPECRQSEREEKLQCLKIDRLNGIYQLFVNSCNKSNCATRNTRDNICCSHSHSFENQ